MKGIQILATTLFLMMGAVVVEAQLPTKQVLTLEASKKIAAAVEAEAIFRRPSKVFEDQVKNGRVAALALPGAVALQGEVPIIVDGKVIGAIGVSGNSPPDEDIAKAGADSAAAVIKGDVNRQ